MRLNKCIAFALPFILITTDARRSSASWRMCFHCHQSENSCATGICYGTHCVKSTVSDYISKGCENRTQQRSSYSSLHGRSLSSESESDDDSQLAEFSTSVGTADNLCYQIDMFGVPNIICYCNDLDFCNFSIPSARPFHILFIIAIVLIVSWSFIK